MIIDKSYDTPTIENLQHENRISETTTKNSWDQPNHSRVQRTLSLHTLNNELRCMVQCNTTYSPKRKQLFEIRASRGEVDTTPCTATTDDPCLINAILGGGSRLLGTNRGSTSGCESWRGHGSGSRILWNDGRGAAINSSTICDTIILCWV